MSNQLTLRKATMIAAVIGLIDSIYLLVIKLTDNRTLCIQGVGDCWTVNTSRYSEWMGIPVSVLGILGYLAIIIVLFLETRNQFFNENGIYMLFGFSLLGTLYSIYLTYIEFFVIHAVCPFCIVSALIMLSIFILSIFRLVKIQSTSIS